MLINSYLAVGLGKRKSSVAQAHLSIGSGKLIINSKSIQQYFSSLKEEKYLLYEPLNALGIQNKYDILIYVKGGGIHSQLESIRLAISKALAKIDLKYCLYLKNNSFLYCDSRKKESKKYGLKKARKAPQYSKR